VISSVGRASGRLHPEHPDGDLDAGLGHLDQRGAIGTRSRQRSLDAVEDGVLCRRRR